MSRTSQLALAASLALGAFLVNDNMSLTQPSSLVSRALAQEAQPRSHVTAAGVERRQYRRDAYGGGAYGGAPYGAYAAYYVDTPGALAIEHYRANWGYGGWNDFATRNGIVCEPGSLIRFPDGFTYLCQ
jgi:hypothetical protein